MAISDTIKQAVSQAVEGTALKPRADQEKNDKAAEATLVPDGIEVALKPTADQEKNDKAGDAKQVHNGIKVALKPTPDQEKNDKAGNAQQLKDGIKVATKPDGNVTPDELAAAKAATLVEVQNVSKPLSTPSTPLSGTQDKSQGR